MFRVLLLALFLSGCMTAQEQAQNIAASDDADCRSYGAQPGSDAYYQCRMAKDQQRQQTRAAIVGAYLSRPAPAPYMLPMPQQPQVAPVNRPMNCTSVPIGNTVSTNCY
jgi:hypothetical protein